KDEQAHLVVGDARVLEVADEDTREMRGRLVGNRAAGLDAVPDRGRARREACEEPAVTARSGDGGERRLGQAEQPAEPEPGAGGDRRRSGKDGGRSGHVSSGGDGDCMAVVGGWGGSK